MTLFGLVAGACAGDDEPTTTATIPPVASTTPAPPTTSIPVTTSVGTDGAPASPSSPATPSSDAPPSTPAVDTADADAAWRSAGFPSEAFPVCCGSNLIGTPSPPFPLDPSAPLDPGLYFAARLAGDTRTDQVSMSVSPFASCDVLGDAGCEPGWLPDDIGVDPEIARVLSLPLDAETQVVVSGWDALTCQGITEETDGATAAEWLELFDERYDLVLADPFRSGDDPATLVAGLSGAGIAGFGVGLCAGAIEPGFLAWDVGDGPGVLLQSVFPATERSGFQPTAPASASAEWVRLTAVRLDEDGWTLYFYAGFVS